MEIDGEKYQVFGTLSAWPTGGTPRIRLDNGFLAYGYECWWTWMERGKRRAMPRRAVVRQGRA